jgi:hypothetical protein
LELLVTLSLLSSISWFRDQIYAKPTKEIPTVNSDAGDYQPEMTHYFDSR